MSTAPGPQASLAPRAAVASLAGRIAGSRQTRLERWGALSVLWWNPNASLILMKLAGTFHIFSLEPSTQQPPPWREGDVQQWLRSGIKGWMLFVFELFVGGRSVCKLEVGKVICS